MIIRIATIEDADALVDFNQAMALETEGKTLNTNVLSKGVKAVFSDEKKGFYVVAEEDNEIIGGLMITYEWSDWRNSGFGGYRAFTFCQQRAGVKFTAGFTNL